MKKKPPPLCPICCAPATRAGKKSLRCQRCDFLFREVSPRLPTSGQLTLLVTLALVLVGCATLKVRRACRAECQDQRGPVMSWHGGPTVPPQAWDNCMSACENRALGESE